MKHLAHLVAAGAICLVLGGAARADAQTVASSFEQLEVLVKPGDTVRVIDAAGGEFNGRIGKLAGGTLTMMTASGPRQFGEADVLEIRQRRQDSLRNGAIIGAVAATGYVVTMLAILSGGFGDGGDLQIGSAMVGTLMSAGMGAAAGAGIDALILRRQAIYRKAAGPTRLGVAPVLGRERLGAAVTLRF